MQRIDNKSLKKRI